MAGERSVPARGLATSRRAPVRPTRALVLLCALGAIAASSPLAAHEYWLDPVDATPDAAGNLFANVRNGQDFVGTSFPFDPARMARLELAGPDGETVPIAARLGDFPAVHTTLGDAGTYLVVLDTYGKELVYDDLEAFGTFLSYHGLERHLETHATRGFPDAGIREIYFRHAKALVRAGAPDALDGTSGGAGDAAGEDEARSAAFAPHGQRLELVPENDPYDDAHIALVLLLDGEPLADAQVELFERAADGAVTRTVARSDDEGRVTFDLARGADYLVNAVQVFEPGDEALALDGPTPHWESRWASLTFERP